MPQYGTWFTYGGAARIWLAVALLAAAVGQAAAGIWLPRPVRGARGGRTTMRAAYLAWVAAMAAARRSRHLPGGSGRLHRHLDAPVAWCRDEAG